MRRKVLLIGVLVALTLAALPAVTSAADPVIQSASPSDDTKITDRTQNFSATVNDSDFQSGDTVDARLYINGDLESNQTISSNSTVDYTKSFAHGGVVDWYWEVEDSGGNTTRISTRQLYVPAQLDIANESNASQLITNTTKLTFYGDNGVLTKTTSTGHVNLTGLEPGDYIVEISVRDGSYIDRSNYLMSPYQNNTVYTLPATNVTTIESRFNLRDPTGEFGSQSVLRIQRPINQSGTLDFVTVVAERFGTEGVTATLKANQRYRVQIISQDQTKIQTIGPYRSDVGETVTVEPGDPRIELGNYSGGWDANITFKGTQIGYALYDVVYHDPSVDTEKLTIYLTATDTESGDTMQSNNETYYDVGTVVVRLALFEKYKDDTVTAHFVVTRRGETYEFTRRVFVQNTQGVPVDLGDGVLQIISGLTLLMTAGLFSQSNHDIGGLVIVAVAGVLYIISFLGGMATATGLIAAGIIAVLYKLGGRT